MDVNDFISQFAYPGRFIVVGRSGDDAVILYGATGRSPSSLARKFVELEDGIYMTASDATVAIHGNPELLEYPAIRYFENGLAVANGQHIERVVQLESRDARQQLSYALNEEAYEPDEHRTPRITGCVIEKGNALDGALHIIRSVADGIDRASYSVPLDSGEGMYISTYTGEDIKPTPSYKGEPVKVLLAHKNPEDAARALYNSLAPKNDSPDYRVGVLAVFKKSGQDPRASIINRIEI